MAAQRRGRNRQFGAAVIAALVMYVVLGSGTATATPPSVTVTDLGTVGGTFSRAVAVNGNGQVVGESYTAGDAATHAFSWTQKGGIVDLGTLGGTFSAASAVNGSGQVVGESYPAGNAATHAALWQVTNR